MAVRKNPELLAIVEIWSNNRVDKSVALWSSWIGFTQRKEDLSHLIDHHADSIW